MIERSGIKCCWASERGDRFQGFQVVSPVGFSGARHTGFGAKTRGARPHLDARLRAQFGAARVFDVAGFLFWVTVVRFGRSCFCARALRSRCDERRDSIRRLYDVRDPGPYDGPPWLPRATSEGTASVRSTVATRRSRSPVYSSLFRSSMSLSLFL